MNRHFLVSLMVLGIVMLNLNINASGEGLYIPPAAPAPHGLFSLIDWTRKDIEEEGESPDFVEETEGDDEEGEEDEGEESEEGEQFSRRSLYTANQSASYIDDEGIEMCPTPLRGSSWFERVLIRLMGLRV